MFVTIRPMRKIFLFMMVSLDGYFEGPNHELDWHNVDQEFEEFANHQLDQADTLVFGRKTYDLMANYWPSEEGIKDNAATAERMNALQKVVFSRSLKDAGWQNTTVFGENVVDTIRSLKEKPGKDIIVLASSNLCLTLIKEGLLDQVRLMINPVVLGKGTSLFVGLDRPYKFKLTNSRVFKSGNVLLDYDVSS